MSRYSKALAAIMLMVAVVFIVGCRSENNDPEIKVTTYTPQDITSNTAVCGGDAIITQGMTLSEIGVCWSTASNPTVEGGHRSTTNWSEPFVCTITGLVSGTQYHVRAYALCGLEYYYGEDKCFTTEEDSGGGNGTYNGHACVDLGLPSGTLWATCNIGAHAPEEYGYFLAWGEMLPKTYYYWNTYQYCNGDQNSLTRYCSQSENGFNGFTDSLSVLLPEDDVVSSFWSGGWCMPTVEQWQELKDHTTMSVATLNEVKGCLVTGGNGNTLFLPAAGHYTSNGNLGKACFYWSSSLDTEDPTGAMGFGYSNVSVIGHEVRYCGLSVRAVCSPSQY